MGSPSALAITRHGVTPGLPAPAGSRPAEPMPRGATVCSGGGPERLRMALGRSAGAAGALLLLTLLALLALFLVLLLVVLLALLGLAHVPGFLSGVVPRRAARHGANRSSMSPPPPRVHRASDRVAPESVRDRVRNCSPLDDAVPVSPAHPARGTSTAAAGLGSVAPAGGLRWRAGDMPPAPRCDRGGRRLWSRA